MTDVITEFKFADEDGYDIPYRLEIDGWEMKFLIKGLINGDIKPGLKNVI